MSISSAVRKAGPFLGNGAAATFAFSFKVFAAADLLVVQAAIATGVETTLELDTDYSVTLNGDQDNHPGGSITLLAGPLATGQKLVITTAMAELQPTEVTNQSGFYPDVFNDSLDRATILAQQLNEQGKRCLSVPVSDDGPNLQLPAAAQRAGKVLSFDTDGNPELLEAAPLGVLPAGVTSDGADGLIIAGNVATSSVVSGDISATDTLSAASVVATTVTANTVNADFNIAANVANKGDSITAGFFATGNFGWAQQLDADFGGSATVNNDAIPGCWMADINHFQVFSLENPGSGRAPIYTLMGGANDLVHGGTGAYETGVYIPAGIAAASWLAIPYQSKVFGRDASVTATGTWANDDTYQSNFARKSTTNGSKLTFTLATSGGDSFLWYRVMDGNLGVFTYAVDGGAPVSVNCFAATAINTYDPQNGSGGTQQCVFAVRIPGLSAGSHTIVVTVTSATGVGNVVSILGVGSAPSRSAAAYQPPKVFWLGVTYRSGDDMSAATAAYNADALANATLLNAGGLRVYPVNVRALLGSDPSLYAGTNSAHPNDAGHALIRAGLEILMHPFPGGGGSFGFSGVTISTYTANATLAGTDTFVLASGGNTPITLTLPSSTASGMRYGKVITILNIGTGLVTIALNTNQLFSTTVVPIAGGQAVTLLIALHNTGSSFWFPFWNTTVGVGNATLPALGSAVDGTANYNSQDLFFATSFFDGTFTRKPVWQLDTSASTSGIPSFSQLNVRAPNWLAWSNISAGYTTATGLATTGGTGTGATVNITAVAGKITVCTVNNGGTGYAVGDVLSITQGAATNGFCYVTSISGGGSTGPVTGLNLPPDLSSIKPQVAMTAVTNATSTNNYGSTTLGYHSSYWNGSASVDDVWRLRAEPGSGTNPTSDFRLLHTGTPGTASFDLRTYAIPFKGTSVDATSFLLNGVAVSFPSPLPFWSYPSVSSSNYAVSANNTQLFAFVLPVPVTFTKIGVKTGTVTDAVNLTSFAIYSLDGQTKYAGTTAQAFASTSTTSQIALTGGGSVTLQPGVYVFATASSSSTQTFISIGTATTQVGNTAGTAPTAGQAPATTSVSISLVMNGSTLAPTFALIQ